MDFDSNEVGSETGSETSGETGGETTQQSEGLSVTGNASEFSEGKDGTYQIGPEVTVTGKDVSEVPSSIEQAQNSVEQYHQQSIDQILSLNGKYMSESDRERVSQGADRVRAIEPNPSRGWSGVYRTSGGKSNITVEAMTEGQMERTTKHETNHFASSNREFIVPDPDHGGYKVYQSVGMRHSSWFHNNETGEDTGFSTAGRGLNEGMTTMYTNEQLSQLNPEKGKAAENTGVYSQSTEICKELQDIVGKDSMAEAYYGGDMGSLKEKVDALGGKGSYEQLEKSLDKTLSDDYYERAEGMREAQDILARMDEAKERGKTA